MELDGYIRVSQVSGRKGDSFHSPTVQREDIARWAASHGHTILTCHEDLDQSGGKMDRPAFNALMERIRSGAAQGVVVAYASRFGRNMLASLQMVEEIESCGGVVLATKEDIDPSTVSGRLMRNLMFSIAEAERDRMTEGWAATQSRAIAQGVHMGCPYGYVRGADRRLEIDPPAAAIVREAFDRRARGDSWSMIRAYLGEATGTRWAATSVNKMIQRRTYLGEAHHGDHVNPDAHPAIVTAAQWHGANRAKKANEARTKHLLSGIVRCANCKGSLTIHTAKRANGYIERRYICQNRSIYVCPTPTSISAYVLEDHILSAMFARHKLVAEAFEAIPDLTAAREEVQEAEERLRQFARATVTSAFPELLAEGLADHEARVRTARTALGQLEASLLSGNLPGIFTLEEMWQDWTVEERRIALGAMVDCVFVRRPDIHICWAGEGPTDLPKQGRRRIGEPSGHGLFVFPDSETVSGVPPLHDGDDRRLSA